MDVLYTIDLVNSNHQMNIMYGIVLNRRIEGSNQISNTHTIIVDGNNQMH